MPPWWALEFEGSALSALLEEAKRLGINNATKRAKVESPNAFLARQFPLGVQIWQM